LGSRCALLRPGLVEYDDALELQRRIAGAVRAGADEALILLEHPPTYTLGVRGRESNLLLPVDALELQGARVVRTDRGGDVTFHGPGQVVGYPIVNLRQRSKGPVWYVRAIEQLLIDTLGGFGISAERAAGRPGVWARGAKIGAIGVRVSGGVTTHGFALNVNTDLWYFEHIVPCGIEDAGVTSMQVLTGEMFAMRDVEDALASAFAHLFGVEMTDAPTLETAEVGVGR
jgi:lipoate-protein ligase B